VRLLGGFQSLELKDRSSRKYWESETKVEVAAVAVVAALIVGAGIGYSGIAGNAVTKTERITSSTTLTSVITSEITSSQNGLELQSTLNTTYLHSGKSILITVNELNTLQRTLNISKESNWAISGLTLSPCGTFPLPFGIEVFHGFYTQQNISAGSGLGLFAPGTYGCPGILAVSHYVFQPAGSNVSIFAQGPNGTSSLCCYAHPGEPAPAADSLPISGYYSSGNFHSFETGAYTVAAGDEWGELVLLHFVVA
jgi:hypothetical protein